MRFYTTDTGYFDYLVKLTRLRDAGYDVIDKVEFEVLEEETEELEENVNEDINELLCD